MGYWRLRGMPVVWVQYIRGRFRAINTTRTLVLEPCVRYLIDVLILGLKRGSCSAPSRAPCVQLRKPCREL
jgi:hypothetical protein